MTDRRTNNIRHMEQAELFARQIESAIKEAGQPLSRAEICEMADMPRGTVYRHTTKMLKRQRLHIVQIQVHDDGSFKPTFALGPSDGTEPERVRVKSQRQSQAPVSVSWLGAL